MKKGKKRVKKKGIKRENERGKKKGKKEDINKIGRWK